MGRDRPRVVGDRLVDLVAGRFPRVPYLAVGEDFRDGLLEWDPLFGVVPGFFALVQTWVFGPRDIEGAIVPFENVYQMFGLSAEWRRRGVSSGDLLDLFGRVDPSFTYTGHSRPSDGRRGKARVITNLGLPGDLEAMAHQMKYAPRLVGGRRVLLISGESAGRFERNSATFRERMTAIDDNTPRIAPPASAAVIQTYLNQLLDQRLFSNRRTGVAARFDDAVERVSAGGRPFDTEAKRDAALRTLTWMREHPMPLYVPCDFSPRLKADRYNPLMNLPSALRPVLYTDRDVELDLDKAHMAALVVVARRLGTEMPIVTRYLTSPERDLWDELAGVLDADALPDPDARRKAVKTSYGAVYGSGPDNLLFETAKRYHDEAGGGFSSLEPLRPLLDHEVMREVFGVRDHIIDHILSDGGLHDADGRFIRVEWFTDRDDDFGRAKSLLAYVCASYEQALVAAAFGVATDVMTEAAAKKAEGKDARPSFRIWLYQADGFTLRVSPKHSVAETVGRVQTAVDERARALGIPTRLSQAWPTV